MPDIAVIIPTRGRAHLIGPTLKSALAQQDVDIEVIVVDDGSIDHTANVVTGQLDGRIQLIRSEHSMGVSRARNRGVSSARSSWIAFLDDDDLWAPDKLRRQLDAARQGGRGWAFAGAAGFDGRGRILWVGSPSPAQTSAEDMPWRNGVPGGCSNAIVRRDLLGPDPFDPRLRALADWDLWIRLAQQGPPAVVDAPLVAYRLHEGNLSCDATGILAEVDLIEKRYTALRGGAPLDRAWLHRWLGETSLRGGDRAASVRAYLRAVAAGDPSSLARAAAAVLGPEAKRRLSRLFGGQDRGYDREVTLWLSEAISA